MRLSPDRVTRTAPGIDHAAIAEIITPQPKPIQRQQVPHPRHAPAFFSTPDLKAVEMDLRRFTNGEYSPRTITAYERDWRVFETWCQAAGRDSLPADTQTVQLYVTDLICNRGRKIDTLRRHASSIHHMHRKHGHPSPCGPELRKLLAGAQRILCQRVVQKAAFTVPQLRQIVQAIGDQTPMSARDCALLVFGMASALRRSNLVMLQLADLDFTDDAITIYIRQEKQDRAGEGRYLTVPMGEHQETCPVRTVRHWMRFRGTNPGPLFVGCHRRGMLNGKPILGSRVNQIVQASVARIGLDQKLYGAHSLRASFITAAVQAKVSDFDIALHTGHRDIRTLRMYYRPGDSRRPLAAASIGL